MRHFSESSEYIQDSPEIEKNSLLIEFLTEELPPINIFENIGSTFANALKKELSSFIIEEKIEVFISPRRFGCIMHNIANKEKNQKTLRKGPSIESAIIDNQPSSALLGFLKSCNLENWQELEQKGGYFYYLQNKKGRSLDSVLIAAINYALKQLPIPKNMRWGNNNFHFIRPVHNLIIMYGNQVICNKSSIFDLHPVNWTLGHR
ncbi:MAG TPA: glycine--tRNA ligase subunit beta, partial [Burkholderiales bacterium]|nr:glycine--tRNA ligase subunit beta [Burkholderiales bacterium]